MIGMKSFTDAGLVAPTSRVSGKQFYVSSNIGSNTYPGTKKQPFGTVDYAIGKASVSGDVIYVMAGHAETLITAGAITVDVGGLTIEGLGNGSAIPTFTLSTGVSDDVNIDASGVTLRNLKFTSSKAGKDALLDVNYGDFTVEDCIFENTSATSSAQLMINLATTKDNFKFKRCQFLNGVADPVGTDGAVETGCVYFVDSENIFFEDCFFYGYFETAIFHNKTTAAKNVWTRNCYGIQMLSGAEVYTQVAAMSGGDIGSMFVVRNAAAITEAETWGTLSVNFFVSLTSCVGNDGANGQVAVSGAVQAS
jgi:hypothetical protein